MQALRLVGPGARLMTGPQTIRVTDETHRWVWREAPPSWIVNRARWEALGYWPDSGVWEMRLSTAIADRRLRARLTHARYELTGRLMAAWEALRGRPCEEDDDGR